MYKISWPCIMTRSKKLLILLVLVLAVYSSNGPVLSQRNEPIRILVAPDRLRTWSALSVKLNEAIGRSIEPVITNDVTPLYINDLGELAFDQRIEALEVKPEQVNWEVPWSQGILFNLNDQTRPWLRGNLQTFDVHDTVIGLYVTSELIVVPLDTGGWNNQDEMFGFMNVVAGSLTPLPAADREITITAKYLGTQTALACPPICQEIENPPSGEDTVVPITFEVCSSATACRSLVSGTTMRVSEDVIVRAPDGETKNQQLATAEEDVFLGFVEWSDGVSDNPHTVDFAGKTSISLDALYSIRELKTITTNASDAGCSWASPIFGPNWVWVDAEYQTILGPVSEAHIAHEDYFGSHNTQDVNFWVALADEEPYKLLSHTQDGQYGQESNQIEVEWESGSYPLWAWPSGADFIDQGARELETGDLAWVKGNWIYDCGHQDDNIVEGAWTEIHPPVAVAIMRGTQEGIFYLREEVQPNFPEYNPRSVGLLAVQLDVWMNGDGGGAVKEIFCGSEASPYKNIQMCLNSPDSFGIQDVYEWEVPLPTPPKLYPESQFLVSIQRLQPGQPIPEVTPVLDGPDPHLEVKVDLTDYQDTWNTCELEELANCNGDAYGFTIQAGWEVFEYPPDLELLRLTVQDVVVYTDMEGEDGDGEFHIYLEIAPFGVVGSNAHEALHDINSGLLDAEGDGESYSLIRDGNLLVYTLKIRKNSQYNNHWSLRLNGYEDDPIWDDELETLERTFFDYYTIWTPDDGYPDWETNCFPTQNANCMYGREVGFGLLRGSVTSPVPYEDHLTCDNPFQPHCSTHALRYIVESIPLPE